MVVNKTMKKMDMEGNPISSMFDDLTKNQKMSVLNLLTAIAVSDGDGVDIDKEIMQLNYFITVLGIRQDESQTYFSSYGYERMFDDLNPLSRKTKEFLVVCAWDIIKSDGDVNEVELERTDMLFQRIGVSWEMFEATIKKSEAIIKYFSKK